jgi:Trk K+ transport system NAD-binding subunit
MVDANQDAVNLAKNQGFKCVHGNALKEETMSEARAETIETFIGLTTNTEINILAAQMAMETFHIPNNYVIISRSSNGAGMNFLEITRANSLFAKKIDIEHWITRIAGRHYNEETILINEKTDARTWIKNMDSNGDEILPLVIETPGGGKRLFRYAEIIESGEIVSFIR